MAEKKNKQQQQKRLPFIFDPTKLSKHNQFKQVCVAAAAAADVLGPFVWNGNGRVADGVARSSLRFEKHKKDFRTRAVPAGAPIKLQLLLLFLLLSLSANLFRTNLACSPSLSRKPGRVCVRAHRVQVIKILICTPGLVHFKLIKNYWLPGKMNDKR